jgi:hypothetical protein
LSLAVSPDLAHDGILWAGTESAGLWLSEDRGHTWRRTGADMLQESVNALIPLRQPSDRSQLLALASEGLFIVHDNGACEQLAADALAEVEPTTVAAPHGADGALLVGLADGRVLRVEVSG